MKRVLGVVAITAGIVLGMQGCLPFGDDKEHRTVDYGVSEPVKELVVEGHTGGVVVTGGGDTVHVTEKQDYEDAPPNTTHEVKDGVLRLTYDCGGCGVGYTVRVPAGTKVRIKEETGGVRLSGLAAEVEAEVDTGGVEATGLTSQQVRLSARTGGVRAEFAAAPVKVEAKTETGGVRVKVPADEAYAVDANAGTGGVDVGIPSQAGAARRITARTDTGGVTVSGV
ncbi:DUF4097 family beta strand repeat-containing protein [Streptomyces rubellomurinus]|uniref:DUF4097 domain-containing protein n=2 Tax=Streptomyces TaxID=1883 RepID=A0A0F2TKR8_STRR3|nr:DUF4097 family beta strand repeat-containing protein [Streptomyces rubellomurinus]KJS55969.1 hypothetical protein VM98_09975 [Streptomyces rubellomurinus subsp. indigoferus]KJS62875.1 hypothetical protein VM95_06495 [Streptomyces rubellomurinus]